MAASKVEFRTLSMVINPVGGDRVTIGLVYAASGDLRCAFRENIDRQVFGHEMSSDVRRVINAVKHRVNAAVPGQKLDIRLDELLPLGEGEGSALVWGPLKCGQTRNIEAHFDYLVNTLRLGKPSVERRETEGLRDQLAELGEELRGRLGEERIATHRETYSFSGFKSPLSWKNGVWRHSVPFEMTGAATPRVVQRKAEDIWGRVGLGIPSGEVPVLVYTMPKAEAAKEEATRFLAYATSKAAPRKIECASAAGGLENLRDRIIRDIAPSATSFS